MAVASVLPEMWLNSSCFGAPQSGRQPGTPWGRSDCPANVEPQPGWHRHSATRLALRNQIPCVSQFPTSAEAGYALTYGTDAVALYGRAAYFVDRILRGANPADTPAEEPTTFVFAANRTTLPALGITPPPDVGTEWNT